MAEYIDKTKLILWLNDWMLQNAPVKAGDDTTRADTIMEAIKMVVDSPAADVRENVKRTQADRIRAMSDEELARFFPSTASEWSCHPGATEEDCRRVGGWFKGCPKCWLDWLKSPVEVDNGGSD